MPVFQKQALLTQLKKEVLQIAEQVKALPATNHDLLNRKPDPERWSVAQVLEHLNFYSRFYLPQLEKVISSTNNKRSFRSGWLGHYFTNMMQPKPDGTVAKKMSAPRNARPLSSLNGAEVIAHFLQGQARLLSLLDRAGNSNLDRRVPTSLSPLIRLKSGDAFRFLIAHQQRHMAQLARTLQAVQ